MRSPKVVQLLKTFDTKDWRECGKYLNGQLRKQHDCLRLYNYIKKYRNKWESKQLDLESIKEQCFANITAKSFTNVLSKLYLNIEDYLVYEQLKSDKRGYKLALLKSLTSRGLFHQFDRIASNLEKEILKPEGADIFDDLLLLQLNHLRFFSDNPIKNEKGDLLLLELQDSSDNFHKLYQKLIETVSLHLGELSIKYRKHRVKRPSSEKLSQVIEQLYQLKSSRNIAVFETLSKLILAKSDTFSKDVKLIILELLIHDGHQQIKHGKLSMVSRLLDLYELGLDSGMLLSNNNITDNRLLNMVMTACANEDYTRAFTLISKYEMLLIPAIKESTIVLAQTTIKFYQEQYDLVVEELRDYYFGTLRQNLRRRWMLLCAYYKLYKDNYEFMESHLKNYNSFLYNNRNKLSPSSFAASLNLSRVIAKMMKGARVEDLRAYADNLDPLIFRSWIIKETGTK